MTSAPNTSTATTPIHAAIAGEALIDLIRRPDGSYLPCLGGALYNLCRALAQQGVGTQYLNPLSRDRFGRELAAQLVADGVVLAQPEPVQQVTSLAVVNLDAQGHPYYAFYREGVADRAVSAAGLGDICAALPALQLVCTGALALDARDTAIYLPWLAAQRAAGRCVVVDANLRPSVMPDLAAYRSTVHAALAHAHIIKASDEDLELLGFPVATRTQAGEIARFFQDQGATRVALTFGAQGAWLAVDGITAEADAPRITLADSVGAGDTFWGNCLADWTLEPDHVPQRVARTLQLAMAAAAINCTRTGCQPPTSAELLAATTSA